jgi:hypothetical protein
MSSSPESATGSSTETTTGSAGGHAAALYGLISSNADLTQELFRQALQDPTGALERIVAIGARENLPVTSAEVKAHIATLDDGASKQWLLKARGGL